MKLKSGVQQMSVHVDFSKAVEGELDLFKAVLIIVNAVILSFSILGHKKFKKV